MEPSTVHGDDGGDDGGDEDDDNLTTATLQWCTLCSWCACVCVRVPVRVCACVCKYCYFG